MGISPSTADRQWTYTRAWLRRELSLGDLTWVERKGSESLRTAAE